MVPPKNTCKHIGYCALTRDDAGYSPELVRIIRTKWCHADYTQCARYRVARVLGPKAVPVDFFPTEIERTETFLAQTAS
ncbi:MAG: hypothetical protein Q7J82_10685 [Coriobacteriia bacterium]|nr:hypothetical protein [Coriobacteriia bacterium]